MTTLTHWKKARNNHYLGSHDLDIDGKYIEQTITIDRIQRESVAGEDGKKDECTVAYLKGTKPMILNVTNQKMIQKLTGTPYIEQWSGQSFVLIVKKVRVGGESVDALRIKDVKINAALPELTPSSPQWADAIRAVQSGTITMDKVLKKYTVSEQNQALLNGEGEV